MGFETMPMEGNEQESQAKQSLIESLNNMKFGDVQMDAEKASMEIKTDPEVRAAAESAFESLFVSIGQEYGKPGQGSAEKLIELAKRTKDSLLMSTLDFVHVGRKAADRLQERGEQEAAVALAELLDTIEG